MAAGPVLLSPMTCFARDPLTSALASGVSAVGLSDLAFSSATSLAEMIAAKKVSSREALELLVARIERHNPALNAIVEVFLEEARSEAAKADDDMAKGRVRGPLHGVPITIKDVYPIAGRVSSYGYPPLKNNIQSADSVLVARLRHAGAILIGRTNVPVFANDWQTFNDLYGRTNNPWDLTRTPGGSSGGCAAAVAAGLSYLSLAGDLGGSIRVPAHFCGIFGHRPSRGIVPVKDHLMREIPPTPEWESFVAGPLARSARDLKTSMLILGGFSAPEDVALQWTMPQPRRKILKEYKLGFVVDDPFCPLVPELRAVYENVLSALRKAGVRLTEGWPEGFDLQRNYLTWAYLTVSGATSGTGVDKLVRGQRPPGKETYFEAARSAETGTFFEYKKQHYQRLRIRKIWHDYFERQDAFLMPPCFVPAFAHGPELRIRMCCKLLSAPNAMAT